MHLLQVQLFRDEERTQGGENEMSDKNFSIWTVSIVPFNCATQAGHINVKANCLFDINPSFEPHSFKIVEEDYPLS